jgi:threonine dehydrogenase-like Zn-dependent dehydrogenase
MKSFLALSDVACTGNHAAVSARVQPGQTVAVVGDGAVGLSAVLAAHRLGAARIIALSRHATRQQVAREFGATDIVEERGQDAIDHVLELTGGYGADAVMECVGTGQSMDTAFGIASFGATVGAVGVPHDVTLPVNTMIFRNTGFAGGVAPARRYIPELLPDVLAGTINPGRVFDYETDLDHVLDAYKAMDERRAIKSMIRM